MPHKRSPSFEDEAVCQAAAASSMLTGSQDEPPEEIMMSEIRNMQNERDSLRKEVLQLKEHKHTVV